MRFAAVAALSVVLAGAALYEERPPPAHTGGFGEPTCARCHFDGAVNAPGGLLRLEGVPERYVPGERYRITVLLTRPDLRKGGFQLAARLPGGTQGGSLTPVDERVGATESGGVVYLHHERAGTSPAAPDTARWVLEWVPPLAPAGPVTFHLAANAANGDASELGDHIYTTTARTAPK